MRRVLSIVFPKGSDLQKPEILRGMSEASAIAIIIIGMFGFVDLLTFDASEYRRLITCLIVRGILCGICGVYLRVCTSFCQTKGWDDDRIAIGHYVAGGMIVYGLVGAGTVYVIEQAGGAESSYFAGLMMVFFGIGIMTPWPPKYSVSLFCVLGILFMMMLVKNSQAGTISTKASLHSVFLVASGIISWYGGRIIFRLHSKNESLSDYSNKRNEGSRAKIFIILILAISVTVLGVFERYGAPATTLPPEESLYPSAIIASGAPDESFEFVNRTGLSVTLEQAQLFMGRDKIGDILPPIGGKKIVQPNASVRIYTGNQTMEYHLGLTKRPATVLERSRFRIYGFRVVTDH